MYSDPEDEDYATLYKYNIMPRQIKRSAIEYCQSCENLIYANSGLYCVEQEMENFASKHAAYNKCQMVYMFLKKVIEETDMKYLKAAISYYKETRVETYPFARDAVREAVFNALIHCNWADNVPVQIRIEDDAMYISNCSMLPFGWTAETLLGSHSSKPYNPDIARVFYRAGYIESWGRGIQKIRDACKNLGTDEPEYMVHGEDIMVKFKALQSAKVTEKVTDIEKRILVILKERPYVTYDEMANEVGVSRKTISQKIKMLKEKGFITREGSAKKGYWTVTAQ